MLLSITIVLLEHLTNNKQTKKNYNKKSNEYSYVLKESNYHPT